MTSAGPKGPPGADRIAAAPTVRICLLGRKWDGKLVSVTGRVLPALHAQMLVDPRNPRCVVHFRIDRDVDRRTPQSFERFVNSPENASPTLSGVGRSSGSEFIIYAIDNVQ